LFIANVGAATAFATGPVTEGVTAAIFEAALLVACTIGAAADWSVCGTDAGVGGCVTFVAVAVAVEAFCATVVGTDVTAFVAGVVAACTG
jgi:hypothetical protein